MSDAQRRRPAARLGEILIERKWLSALQLLRALARQQGVGFEARDDGTVVLQTTIRPATSAEPVYISKVHDNRTETVWTYGDAASTGRSDLLETFGFDPARWNPDLGSDGRRRT